jgi:hypothetical protein
MHHTSDIQVASCVAVVADAASSTRLTNNIMLSKIRYLGRYSIRMHVTPFTSCHSLNYNGSIENGYSASRERHCRSTRPSPPSNPSSSDPAASSVDGLTLYLARGIQQGGVKENPPRTPAAKKT